MEQKKLQGLLAKVDLEIAKTLPYPFQDLTLRQLILLSNQIEIITTNQGNSSELRVNDTVAEDFQVNTQTKLLGYIKMVGLLLENYILQDSGSVHDYVINAINTMEQIVTKNGSQGLKTFPSDFQNAFGFDAEGFNGSKLYRGCIDAISIISYYLGYSPSYDDLFKVSLTSSIRLDDLNALSVSALNIIANKDKISQPDDFYSNYHVKKVPFDEWIIMCFGSENVAKNLRPKTNYEQ